MNRIIKFIKDYLIGVIIMFFFYWLILMSNDNFIRICSGIMLAIGFFIFTTTLVRIENKKWES